MPPKVRRAAQKKQQQQQQDTRYDTGEASRPPTLLFVNKGQHNLKTERSIEEQTAIKLHLSQRQQKRIYHKPINFHTSTQKILKQDDGQLDAGESSSKQHLLAQFAHSNSYDDDDVKVNEFIADRVSDIPQSIGTTVLDPFVSRTNSNQHAAKLTVLYLRHIRPLAATVSPEWDWIDNVAEIQASEMVTNAIAAYTTAFFDGMKGGSQGVVLPPLPDKERAKQALWDLPSWFRYYNQCLTSLSQMLLDPKQGSRSEVYHTVLFLLRLTVLFGDGPSANMHFKALRQVARLQGRSLETLSYESSVTQVNFVTLFLYKAVMVKTANKQLSLEHPAYVIEPDSTQWVDQREWKKFAGMLYGRSLTWHAKALDTLSIEETQKMIQRLEPDSTRLPSDILTAVARYCQLSLFLWSYLTGINYDPSLPKIKLHVEELERYLRSADISSFEQLVPKVLFFLYFCGTHGSRGQPSRRWFIQKLKSTTIQVYTMRDLWAELESFMDPAHCMPILLEEILHEMGRKDIYSGGRYRKWYGQIPINRDPDLQSPIRVVRH